jgi:hypothetical protein
MAFIPEGFKLGKGNTFSNTPIGGAAIHTYKNIEDSIQGMLVDGYFPPYFGQDADSIGNNDYIYLVGFDQIILANFSNIGSSPVIKTTFNNVTRTSGTLGMSFTGPWGPPFSVNLPYRTINSMVILSIPKVYIPAPQSGIIVSSGPTVPANLRPFTNFQTSIPVLMPTIQEGYILIDSGTGVITINQFGPHVTGASSYGFPDLTVFYFNF